MKISGSTTNRTKVSRTFDTDADKDPDETELRTQW